MYRETMEYMILGQSPEEINFVDIKNIVIPALRKRITNLFEKNNISFLRQESNFKAINILIRAKALCGDLNEMTGYELNDSVKILREEYKVIRSELQKFGEVKE